jgi:putative ABC transport system permease protein
VTLLHELRLAARRLRTRWAFTTVATLTMALGIGANVALFSFVHTLLIRPLPFQGVDRLISLSVFMQGEHRGLSFREIDDLRERSRHLADIAAYDEGGHYNLSGGDRPEDLLATRCTHNLFRVLGIAPVIGGSWADADDRRRTTEILISHALWTRHFHADPAIVGKQVLLVDVPYTVRGVTPPGFAFPSQSEIFRSWGTLNLPMPYQNRALRFGGVVARLKPGVSFADVQAELDVIAGRLAGEYPATNAGVRFVVRPLREIYVGETRPYLLLLSVAVALVFLVALANVANLLLIRGVEQRRAVAIHLSLGASSWQAARSLLSESLLLAALGGAAGLLFANVLIGVLTAAVRWNLPPWMEIGIDRTVLGFLILLTALMGLVAGALPMLQVVRVDLNELLKQGLHGFSPRSLLRTVLVSAEVAFAVLLLIGAALLTESFARLTYTDLGYDAKNLLTFRLTVPWKRYGLDGTIRFHREVLERLRRLPGVEAAFLSTDSLVAEQLAPTNPVRIEGQAVAEQDSNPLVWMRSVSPGYHAAMRIPLRRGRLFEEQDQQGRPPVAMVDEKLAARLWPDQDPIGRKLQAWPAMEGTRWLTVVGVVGNVRAGGPVGEAGLTLYTCAEQLVAAGAYYVLRTRGDPRALAPVVERVVMSVDPQQATTRPTTVTDLIGDRTWQRRVAAMLFGLFASLALVLAAIGIYGVISYHVAQQTPEIGLRLALGAQATDVARLVGRDCLRFVSIGLGAGLVLALWLSRFLATILFETSSRDALAFLTVPILLIAVALVAAYVPARRATRVDPVIALRDAQ